MILIRFQPKKSTGLHFYKDPFTDSFEDVLIIDKGPLLCISYSSETFL
jgi:hypothetical protein